MDSNGQIALQYDDNGTWKTTNSSIKQYTGGTTPATYSWTNTVNTTKVRFLMYANKTIPTGNSSSRYKNAILTVNNSDLSYEPYVGGIPAPNPDYPQPISVVTGENVVKVADKDYPISLTGKNLFNKATSTDGYRIDSNGDPYANASYFISDYIVVQPSTTYAYSRGAAGSGLSTIAYYKSDKTFISRTMPTIDSSGTSGTVTTPNNAYYARFCDVNEVLDSAQLELGSTATEYAAYSPIELAGVGEIQPDGLPKYHDKVKKNLTTGKWYIEKQINKVVLDGTEAWSRNLTNDLFYLSDAIDYVADGTAPMSDNFTGQSNVTSYAGLLDAHIATLKSTTSNRLVIKYLAMSGVIADFKTWLGSHNTTVYYALATPTTTEITNQALIDQLEALASATLNQGVNNIFTEIETGNAMPTLELNWIEWQKYNKHNVYIWNDDIDDWQVIVS